MPSLSSSQILPLSDEYAITKVVQGKCRKGELETDNKSWRCFEDAGSWEVGRVSRCLTWGESAPGGASGGRLLEAVADGEGEDVGGVVPEIVAEPDGRHAGDERVEGVRSPVGLLERLERVAEARGPVLPEVIPERGLKTEQGVPERRHSLGRR